MELKEFKQFICKVISEGNRLQSVDIAGQSVSKNPFVRTETLTFLLSITMLFLLPKGLTDNFSEYAIAFLGIFVGLFTSIVIALYDKSKELYKGYDAKTPTERAAIKMLRNYLVKFTGLTSYSILLALVAVMLLLGALLCANAPVNIYHYRLVKSFYDIKFNSLVNFGHLSVVCVFRFFIFYILLNFFVITLYAITSYFSFLLSEYSKLGNDEENS
jgi:hypothetical protein